MAVVHAGAADVLILKAQPLGGVTNAWASAEQCGLPVTISSALETRVGMQAGFALATALGGNTAHGLGTESFFIEREPFGQLASLERRTWWLERLERVLAI
jgi:O-succinylbenzoate synthase